ncbi:MAG: hypothetical protein ABIH59_03395 [archaeon]
MIWENNTAEGDLGKDYVDSFFNSLGGVGAFAEAVMKERGLASKLFFRNSVVVSLDNLQEIVGKLNNGGKEHPKRELEKIFNYLLGKQGLSLGNGENLCFQGIPNGTEGGNDYKIYTEKGKKYYGISAVKQSPVARSWGSGF